MLKTPPSIVVLTSSEITEDAEEINAKPLSHAYHHNLPRHYIDSDGVPLVTKYANKKARTIVELARSIRLTEDSFLSDHEGEPSSSIDVKDHDNTMVRTSTASIWKLKK